MKDCILALANNNLLEVSYSSIALLCWFAFQFRRFYCFYSKSFFFIVPEISSSICSSFFSLFSLCKFCFSFLFISHSLNFFLTLFLAIYRPFNFGFREGNFFSLLVIQKEMDCFAFEVHQKYWEVRQWQYRGGEISLALYSQISLCEFDKWNYARNTCVLSLGLDQSGGCLQVLANMVPSPSQVDGVDWRGSGKCRDRQTDERKEQE